MKTTLLALSAASVLAIATTGPARAESFEHVDELAREVQQRANDVCWEMYNGFRFQPGFRETYRDAKEIWSIAGHLHDLVHNSSSRTRVQRNAAELDELLHGLRGDVAAWCGSGMHGCSFRLKRKLAALDEAVEHLMEDVGVVSKYVAPPVASPAAAPNLPPDNLAPSVAGARLGLAPER